MENSSSSFLIRSVLWFILITGAFLLNTNCSSSNYIPEKMETSLQLEIKKLEKENSDILIQFKGKTNGIINDDIKSKLKETGLIVESVIGDIFTASGNAESIKKTTHLEFVVFLESGKQMDLKQK